MAKPFSKRALIVEVTKYHGYLLYPQARMLLDAGYEVTVLVPEANQDIQVLNAIQDRIRIIKVPANRLRLISLILFWMKLRVHLFDSITFNTMTTTAMILGLLSATEVRFIYHHHYLTRSSFFHTCLFRLTRRKASRLLLISEHVYSSMKKGWDPSTRHKIGWFDPAYLQDYVNPDGIPLLNSDQPLIFVIPGQITAPQRNYQPLIDSFQKISESSLKDRIQIYLMGNYFTSIGRAIVRKAYETGTIGSVLQLQHEKYSSFDKFAAGLRRSHFMIPCLDDTTTNMGDRKYNSETVATSLILGRAFSLPFILSDKFDLDTDLEPFCIRFTGDNLFEGITRAVQLLDSGEYYELQRRFRSYMEQRYPKSLANYVGQSST